MSDLLPPKYNRQLDQASSGLGSFFCVVLAAIVVVWLCHDTSAGLTRSLHHERDVSTLGLLLEWIQ